MARLRLLPPFVCRALGAATALLVLLGCGSGDRPHELPFLLGGIQINEPDMNHWHDRLLEEGFNTVSLTTYARQQGWSSGDLSWDRAQLESGVVDEMRAAKRKGLRTVLILRVALEQALPENRFLWHGQIAPVSDREVEEWFARYCEYVDAWAEVAQREGVDVLGIGSELSAMTSTRPVDAVPELEAYYLDHEKQALERARTLAAHADVDPSALQAGWHQHADSLATWLDQRDAALAVWARRVAFDQNVSRINQRRALLAKHWRRLIADVRQRFDGKLTYAANFDQYQDVAFWDALDLIGVNAYFPLRGASDAPAAPRDLLPLFQDRWREVLGAIDTMRSQRGLDQPVLFTEIGYTARAGATLEPWAKDGIAILQPEARANVQSDAETGARPAQVIVWDEQPEQPLERALALQALHEAAQERPGLLRGLLWWKLSTVPQQREIESFVVLIDRGSRDPVLDALRAFAR